VKDLEKVAKDLERTLQTNKLSLKAIKRRFDLSRSEAREILDKYGSALNFDGVLYHISRSTLPNYNSNHTIHFDKDEIIGILGDTHLCSKYTALASLHEYYDELQQAGVKKVFHAGDLTDGYMVYKGQISDLIAWGEPDQRRYTVENYPRKVGLTTFVIAGNHDSDTFLHGGADIVENICKERPDMKYVGMHYARFRINNSLKFDLLHDTARRAYALSYPSQIRQRDTPPSERPDMSAAGHRHVTFYTYYNDEHMFEAGCFEHSSPYMRGRGIQATIAAWIARLKIDDDYIKSLEARLISFKDDRTK
jgi:predicted phosphodiesterase